MPKKNLYYEVGKLNDANLLNFLYQHFTDKEIERLEKFGGRIQISITAPFNSNKSKQKKIIDESIYKLLNDNKNDKQKLENILTGLSKKQLTEICKEFELPLKTSYTIFEIKNMLKSFLHSEIFWKKISGRK